MAIMRLTGLDSLGRNLSYKNILIFSVLLEYISVHCSHLNKNCIYFFCKILSNAHFYMNYKISSPMVYKQNSNYLNNNDFNFKLNNVFSSLNRKEQDFAKIYSIIKTIFEIAGKNILNYRLINSRTFLLR